MAVIAVILLYLGFLWLVVDLTVEGINQLTAVEDLQSDGISLPLTSEPHDHKHLMIVGPPVILPIPSAFIIATLLRPASSELIPFVAPTIIGLWRS
jgi:hypothetical protein